GDHLQAMLYRAQEAIGLVEIAAHVGRDPTARLQALECHEGLRHAQLRLAAASNELLGLSEELDLADAAAADLDVVPRDGDLAETAKGVDLTLHRVNVGDSGKVEVLAPNERREAGKKTLAGGDVARNGPRLDEGGALPVLADALVIVERGLGGDGERGG